MRKRQVLILSIDGGGIRGIIPAAVLKNLESRFNEKPLCDQFDLMAGTSTGSIIALGLAAPARDGDRLYSYPAHSAADILNIYLKQGENIFPRGRMPSLRTMSQAFSEKYDPEGIDNTLGNIFGYLTLRDALTNLLITSCRTETGSPLFFKNRPARLQGNDDENFLMKDAARGATAAPTYFPPAYIHPLDNEGNKKEAGYTLVDGALVASNPALCAYIEARKIFPKAKKYVILSLGTGRIHPSYEYDDVNNWGYLDWVNPANRTPLWSLMVSSQSESVRHQLYKLPGIEYYRINGALGDASSSLDNASPENMEELIRAGERIISENSEELERFVSYLK